MITTGRSESINAFIKRFVSSHTCLTDFVKQVDLAVQEIRQGRLHEKVVATLRPVSLSTKSPLEKQAREVFSPFAFNKFQEEFTKAALYTINEVDNNNFVIKYFEGDTSRQQKVFWDENISMCTGKNFEFWGIICRHILRVFVHKDCFTIPLHYLPLRWHCDESEAANSMEDNNLVGKECLANNSLGDGDVVLCPPPSKTKGRPKTKRCHGGKELGVNKTKCCSISKQSGHTKPACPNKENFFNPNILDGDISLASQKKRKHTAEDFGLNPIFTLKI